MLERFVNERTIEKRAEQDWPLSWKEALSARLDLRDPPPPGVNTRLDFVLELVGSVDRRRGGVDTDPNDDFVLQPARARMPERHTTTPYRDADIACMDRDASLLEDRADRRLDLGLRFVDAPPGSSQ